MALIPVRSFLRSGRRDRGASMVAWVVGSAVLGSFLGFVIMVMTIMAPVAYVTSKIVNIPLVSGSIKLACKTPLLGSLMPGSACDAVGAGDDELMKAAEETGLSAVIRAYFDCANQPPEAEEQGLCDPNALAKREGGAIPANRGWTIPIFVDAANTYDVPWQVLAAVAGAHTKFGEENCWDGLRGGFMGMTAKEWRTYAVDAGSTRMKSGDSKDCFELFGPQDPEVGSGGVLSLYVNDPDGKRDPRDPVDAIHTYARMLAAHGAKGAREWKYNGSPGNSCDIDQALDGKVHPAPTAATPGGTDVNIDAGGASATYPGDDAPKPQIAAWMAGHSVRAGFPAELPVMAALVESGLRNIDHGHWDSLGYFQMRTSIWNKGEYAGYPTNADLQIRWFINQAKATKAGNTWKNTALTSANYGEFIADVERPAAQYRHRYQLRLDEARTLIRQGGGASAGGNQAGGDAPASVTVRGSHAFPVNGRYHWADTWGGARSDGRGGHKGQDIFAARGTPLVAVEDGQLYNVGVASLGGNRLWLKAPGMHYYYAHLDRFAPGITNGMKVKKGQFLGTVGTTGNAAGTPPHLHFEMHPTGYDSAIPNASHLRAWENNTSTPAGGGERTRVQANAPSPSGGSGQAATGVTAQTLKAYVTRKRPSSPFLKELDFEWLVTESQKAGVDPRMVIAISAIETQFGTTGRAGEMKNAWGLMKQGSSFHTFPKWEDGVQMLLRTLVNYRKEGLVTIAQIQTKYCPVGAANDPNNTNGNWKPVVEAIYTEMGGDPSKSVHTGGGDDYTSAPHTGTGGTGTSGGPYTGKKPTDKVSKALRVREGEPSGHSDCYIATVHDWHEAIVNGVSASPGGVSASGTTGGPLLEQFMTVVRAQIGKPYIWGAGGPSTFDCSGLFNYGFEQIGKPRPGRWIVGPEGGNTATDYTDQAKVDPQNWEEGTDFTKMREGDFIIANWYGHILVYAGNGKYIHAAGGQSCPNRPGSRCRVVEDSDFMTSYRRNAAKWVRYKPFWVGAPDPNAPKDAAGAGNDKTVWVQAGHVAPREPGYGAQPGAAGEAAFNQTIATKVIASLKSKGIDARYLPGRVDPIGAKGAVFLSIHHDEPKAGRGFAAYAITGEGENYYAGDGAGQARDAPVAGAVPHRTPATLVSGPVQARSKALASRLDAQMRSINPSHWTGLGRPTHENDRRAMRYYGFYRTNAEARVLLEVGRGGTPFLLEHDKITSAITKAVVAHLNAQ